MSQSLNEIAAEVLASGKGRAELIRRVPGTTIWAARRALEQARRGVQTDPVEPRLVASSPLLHAVALRLLRKGTTIDALAEKIGGSKSLVEAVLAEIDASGYSVSRAGDAVTLANTAAVDDPDTRVVVPIDREHQNGGGEVTFGFITDTHLCSKFQRLDVLTYAYDTFKKRGVKAVFHAGNLVDGESRVNEHDLLVHGIAEQAYYTIDHYPQVSGVTTYFIDGDDHEGWWKQREGIEFGRYLMFEAITRGRNDLKYCGYLENDVPLRIGTSPTIIRVMHPGGGSSYAYSYTSQKLVESFQAGEKPQILLVGHYHKADYCVARHVHVVQGGCCQDQSTFMRKKRLEAMVGFWIIKVTVAIDGSVSAFLPEFFPFFDRAYYSKRDDIAV